MHPPEPEGTQTGRSPARTGDAPGPWRRAISFAGPSGLRMIGALGAASLIAGLVEAGLLSLIVSAAAALSSGTSDVPLEFGPFSFGERLGIPTLLALAAGLAVVRGGIQFFLAYVPASMMANLQERLRNEISELFLACSWDVQSRERDGHLQDLLTYQVNQATMGIGVTATAVAAVVTFGALILSALLLDPLAAMVMVLAGVVLFAMFRPISKMVRRAGVAVARANAAYASELSETVRMAEEMAAFGVHGAKSKRLAKSAEDVREPLLRAEFTARAGHGLYQVVAIFFVIGGLIVVDVAGSTRVAALGAVVLVLVRAAGYGGTAQNAFHMVNQYAPHLEIVAAAKDRYAGALETYGNRKLTGIEELRFDDVGFSYIPGRPVVSHTSFVVRQGEAIGIVGPSGSGKSTCLQLLLRLRSPDTGSYLVNGVPADEFTRDDWTRLVGYVPQDARVLAATIADNIRFYRDIGIDEVEKAAKLAHIHDDIMAMPAGYDSVIGQRADALSGGQRQRLCLARALAGNPQLLVLDEPTSALDSASEELVNQSIENLKGQLTVVIVAHRLSILRACDRIMVFRNGHLEAFEDVARLEHHSDYYREAMARGRGA